MHTRAPVSAVVPCYNSSKTIGRALESILHQTLQVSEVIIIDDKSQDSTIIEARKYQKLFDEKKIKFILLENDTNQGASYSRNRGLQNATGEYIAFLDSDDVWHPQKTELQIELFDNNNDIFIIGGYQIQINAKNDIEFYYKKDILSVKHTYVNKKGALFKNPTQTSVVMLRNKSNFLFDENKKLSEDYLLWLDIIFSGRNMLQLHGYAAAAFKSSFGESGLSSNLLKMQINEIDTLIRIRRKYCKSFIDGAFYGVAISFSILKFLRRKLLVYKNKVYIIKKW